MAQRPSTSTRARAPVTEVHENTDQEIIMTTHDKIKIVLMEYVSCVESANAWQMPFSLLIGVLLVFCTADFRTAFGIKAEVWFALFMFMGGAFAFWLIHCLIKRNRALTLDALILKVKNKT